MITAAFDLALWTILFFILGMIKPKWPLFFLKKPDRFIIVVISTVLVMITMTLWGEGNRRERAEKEAKNTPPKTIVSPATAPVPIPSAAPAEVQNNQVAH